MDDLPLLDEKAKLALILLMERDKKLLDEFMSVANKDRWHEILREKRELDEEIREAFRKIGIE